MFKKSLVAASVAMMFSVPALAQDVSLTDGDGNEFEANVIAKQTRQDVLDKVSLDAKLVTQYDNTKEAGNDKDELVQGAEYIIELKGDAKFNETKIADALTAAAGGFDSTVGQISIILSDAADLDDGATKKAPANVSDIFKVDELSGQSVVRYELDKDNQRLSLRLNDDFSTAVVDLGSTGAANTAVQDAFVTITTDFSDNVFKQGFKLTENSVSSTQLEASVLDNGSYSANPESPGVVFKRDDLFTLEQVRANDNADKTALVSDSYKQWGVAKGAIPAVKIKNNTTLQNIQYGELLVTLEGDFSAFAKKDGELLDGSGAKTGWKINSEGKIQSTYNDFPGVNGDLIAGGAKESLELPAFYIAEDNDTPIEAQKMTLSAEMLDTSDTFTGYTKEIGNVFIVDRDGMKFDTVTTGSTSQNTIFIRDVSGELPAEGGQIFVTITEYDAHGNAETGYKGEGNVLVANKALDVRLPSNGAVTLSPQVIAEKLGANVGVDRQARFYFEVETNEGEAAVKKATSDGVDIQTDAKNSLDFTL